MNEEVKSAISIYPPLEGEWKFLCPPGHHPNAFDFVKPSPNRKTTHKRRNINLLLGRIDAKDYYCWGKPVFSPISGKVIHASDGWKDHLYTNLWRTIIIWFNATYRFRPKEHNGRLDIRPNAGNYVMIEADEGYIVFLAHMKEGSVLVKEGQRLDMGDQVGQVGNSGNSTAPHLHINLFDQMDDPYKAEVLPFVFKQFDFMTQDNIWAQQKFSVPAIGDFVRFDRITNQSNGTPKTSAPY